MNTDDVRRVLDLADADIGNFTVSQLKLYIRTALNIVNEGDFYSIDDYEIENTYETLKENFIMHGKRMYGGVSGARKDELFEKAMDLKIHMKSIEDFYVPDENNEGELSEKARKTYENVKKRWEDEDLSEADFRKVVQMFAYFGRDVLERDLDSDQIYSIYQEIYDEKGERVANSVFDIMKYQYKYMKKNPKIFGGMEKEDFTNTWAERVKDEIRRRY